MSNSLTNKAQPTKPEADAIGGLSNKKSFVSPLGNLEVLPTEILFQILDELLWSTPNMTHESFCSTTRLMLTNKALEQVVRAWMMGRKVRGYINDCLYNQWCLHPSSPASESMIWQLLVHKEPFSISNDLITGIIRDDCVDCYNVIREILPDDDKFSNNLVACINEQGWSFWALALHARAYTVLSVHQGPEPLKHHGEVD
ncbi:hypothetical protein MYU51_020439 [Penicillium brevicompactum]